jgi:hypothetical protein
MNRTFLGVVLFCLAVGLFASSPQSAKRSIAVSQSSGTLVPDGNYVALEKMPNISPDEPKASWFHENTLVIRNDEAILDKVPVVFLNGKKEYSASDGAFMTFRGRFFTKDGVTLVMLRMCRSDYLVVPLNHPQDRYKEVKTYPVKLSAGRVEFAGVSYKIGKVKQPTLAALLHELDTEPLEKE